MCKPILSSPLLPPLLLHLHLTSPHLTNPLLPSPPVLSCPPPSPFSPPVICHDVKLIGALNKPAKDNSSVRLPPLLSISTPKNKQTSTGVLSCRTVASWNHFDQTCDLTDISTIVMIANKPSTCSSSSRARALPSIQVLQADA
eukprot:764309-Hanusia_phi.AAC.2